MELWRSSADLRLTRAGTGERHDRPDVAATSAGEFAVAWRVGGAEVAGLRALGVGGGWFDGYGRAAPGGFASAVQSNAQLGGYRPQLAELADGRLVVGFDPTSSSGAASETGAVAVLLVEPAAASALSLSPAVTRASTGFRDVDVVATGFGGFLAVWEQPVDPDPADRDIVARLYGADGVPLDAEFRVNAVGPGAQRDPRAILLDDARVVVAWRETTADIGLFEARLLSADLVAVGGDALLSQYAADFAIAPLSGGRFVAVWSAPTTTRGLDLAARIFAADGTPMAPAFSVAQSDAGDQREPAIAVGADGSLTIAWTGRDADGTGVRLRRFDAAGVPLMAEIAVNAVEAGAQAQPALAFAADGRLLVTWSDPGGIAAASFALTTPIDGGAAADVLMGGAAADLLRGQGGDDRLAGGGGGDRLEGGAGDDRLDGGPGGDILDGGAGTDTAVYRLASDWSPGIAFDGRAIGSGAAVTLDDGSGAPDTLVGIERLDVTGSDGDDDITGGTGADLLVGGAGDDRLDGGRGADRLEGGAGDDLFLVDDPGDIVVEAGGGGRDRVEAAIAYVLPADVEDLLLVGAAADGTGNALANRIVGNALDNRLMGLDGADVLEGGSGADTLDGGAGDDWLDGGPDIDRIDGGAGSDTVAYTWNDRGVIIDLSVGASFDGVTYETYVNIENTAGSRFADTVFGSPFANIIAGDGGNDLLYGEGGNDMLFGGDGDDVLVGGDGRDRFDGGAGSDTVSYADAPKAVIIDLDVQAVWTGDFQELLASVENAVGTAGRDSIFGSPGDNVIEGGEGADYLYGGPGFDTASYAGAPRGVIVDFSVGLSFDGASQDTLIDFEAILGSAFADTVFGSGRAETMRGGAGNDKLNGEAGNDILDGGAGDDVLEGGSGDDLLRGGSGRDTLNGGTGTDTAAWDDATGPMIIDLDVQSSFNGNFSELMSSIENAIGSAHVDSIFGSSGANRIDGGGGGDYLYGGGGRDIFVLAKGEAAGDRIVDFTSGVDRIELTGWSTGTTITLADAATSQWRIVDAADGMAALVTITGAVLPTDIIF